MGFDEIARQIYSHHQVEKRLPDVGRLRSDGHHQGPHHARGCALCLRAAPAPMENVLSTGTHFILKKYKDYGVEFDPSDRDKREVMMAW